MIRRHLTNTLLDSLAAFPVCLVVGPRQVGKSTLVEYLSKNQWPARYLTLDDRTILDAALTNPDGFVQGLDLPVVIDEVQRAPDLMRAIKLVVDRNRQPGKFMLTGSANVMTLGTVSETLAGRVAVHELYPFSWTEFEDLSAPKTLDIFFSAKGAADVIRMLPKSCPTIRIKELKELLLKGGFPDPSMMQRISSRNTWFESYRKTYIDRDLRDIATISNVPEFNRLFTTLALRSGQMLNFTSLSRDVGLPNTTLRRYFSILEQTFQVFLIHPYHSNFGKRLVKTPKLYLADTGMAAHLSAAPDWKTLESRNQDGAMLETWVAGELRKLASLHEMPIGIFYWRTRGGREVDFLLERGGQVVGIEVKQAAGVNRRDLAGLKSLRDALGTSWRMGVFLYGGTEVVPLEDDILAIPFSIFFGRDMPLN
jgi:predicted AAA+ superfamily ATPase